MHTNHRASRLTRALCSRLSLLVGGMMWAHASTVVVLIACEWAGALGLGLTGLAPTVAAWTLLLPSTVTALITSGSLLPLSAFDEGAVPSVALWVTPLATGVTCLALRPILTRPHSRALAIRLAGAAALIGMAGVGSLIAEAGSSVRAETLFIEMSRPPLPHLSDVSVALAEKLTAHHPRSRWASEAWRVRAMSAEAGGDFEAAAKLWGEFRALFEERPLPGTAIGHFNTAVNLERLGAVEDASRSYRSALRAMQAAGAETQPWLPVETSRSLSRLHAQHGMPATARYWGTRAREYEDLYHQPSERSQSL